MAASTRGELRTRDIIAELCRRPLLRVPLDRLVLPPLHILQGLVNKIVERMDAEARRLLVERTNVRVGPHSKSLLTGGEVRKLLDRVHAYPPLIENEHVRAALLDVRAIQQWARTTGADVTPDGIARLRLAIAAFSASWRAAQLPTTPKLHLVEQHVADLIEQQGGWGERGEQALEATHKLGVAADHRCFGANAERGLEFFLKHQLAIALADTQNLLPKNAHVQSTLLDEEETYY